MCLDPYVAVVNVSGGRAGGRLCPHTLEKMFHPIPCNLGSSQTFSTVEAREEASLGYHRWEWAVLAALDRVGLQERGRLALRMVTQLQPGQVDAVLEALHKPGAKVPKELEVAVRTFQLSVATASEEEKLVSTSMGLWLVQCLQASGFLPASPSLAKEQLAVFTLLQRALLVALHHTK